MSSCIKSFSTCRIGPLRIQFNQMLPDLLTLLPAVITHNLTSLNQPLLADSVHMTLSVFYFIIIHLKTLYCVIIRGVLPSQNPALLERIPSIITDLFPVASTCLQHSEFNSSIPLQKCVKWCLKIALNVAKINRIISQPFVVTMAQLCNQLLFSFWSLPIDYQQLYISISPFTHRMEFWSILFLISSSISFLIAHCSDTPALHEFYSDDCIQQLLRCLHLSMFAFTRTQQQQCIDNGEAFYWSQVSFLSIPKFKVNSVVRTSTQALYENITEVYPTQVTTYLASFYQNSTSSSIPEIYGYLCMLEGSRSHLSKILSISDIWVNVLQPCIANGLMDSSFYLPVMECLRVIRTWYPLMEEQLLMEVNIVVITCLKSGLIGVRT